MNIEQEILEIWAKYKPKMDAEAEAYEIQSRALQELDELNKRRAKAGLAPVSEDSNLLGQQAQNWCPVSAKKTWRDNMDAELVSACKRWASRQ